MVFFQKIKKKIGDCCEKLLLMRVLGVLGFFVVFWGFAFFFRVSGVWNVFFRFLLVLCLFFAYFLLVWLLLLAAFFLPFWGWYPSVIGGSIRHCEARSNPAPCIYLDCFVPRNDGRLSLIGKAIACFRHYKERSNPEDYRAPDCFAGSQ
jgi:hypothetical protein